MPGREASLVILHCSAIKRPELISGINARSSRQQPVFFSAETVYTHKVPNEYKKQDFNQGNRYFLNGTFINRLLTLYGSCWCGSKS